MPTARPELVEGAFRVGMSDSLEHQKHACRGQAWHRIHFLPTFMNYTLPWRLGGNFVDPVVNPD
jgi:hypothetical protein